MVKWKKMRINKETTTMFNALVWTIPNGRCDDDDTTTEQWIVDEANRLHPMVTFFFFIFLFYTTIKFPPDDTRHHGCQKVLAVAWKRVRKEMSGIQWENEKEIEKWKRNGKKVNIVKSLNRKYPPDKSQSKWLWDSLSKYIELKAFDLKCFIYVYWASARWREINGKKMSLLF